MRRDVIKGTADAIRKQKYMAMNTKMKAKEQQIEEAKQLVDAMIEKRRQDLAEKHEVATTRIKKVDVELLARQQQLKDQEESSLMRVKENRENRLGAMQLKAEQAQLKRD